MNITKEEVQQVLDAMKFTPLDDEWFLARNMLQSKLAEKDDGEPVGHLHSNGDFCQTAGIRDAIWPVPLFTHPDKQTPWVGLTDDEVVACYDQVYGFNMQWGAFYKVIEAKLKEKNT